MKVIDEKSLTLSVSDCSQKDSTIQENSHSSSELSKCPEVSRQVRMAETK